MLNLEAAKKAQLEDKGGVWWTNEVSNSEIMEILEDGAVRVCEDELYVFSDGSCINRQGDEYYLNDDVDTLDDEFLESVGY